jgi:hypothetical protein
MIFVSIGWMRSWVWGVVFFWFFGGGAGVLKKRDGSVGARLALELAIGVASAGAGSPSRGPNCGGHHFVRRGLRIRAHLVRFHAHLYDHCEVLLGHWNHWLLLGNHELLSLLIPVSVAVGTALIIILATILILILRLFGIRVLRIAATEAARVPASEAGHRWFRV